MTEKKKQELNELFHQPVRLEIMAELCSTSDGKTFTELRERCELTDGNLSRHLQALAQDGAIKLKKSFLNSRPLTTVSVTPAGRKEFLRYLETLEDVLNDAVKRTKKHGEAAASAFRPLKAVRYRT